MVSGQYWLTFHALDLNSTPALTVAQRVYLTIDDPAYPSTEQLADQVVDQCNRECADKSEYGRALWLHDWLIDHMDYDNNYYFCDAEGAFARKKGTCESYHRAFTMLLKCAGIQSGRIASNVDHHVWMAVKMDSVWYQVDTTHDDTSLALPNYPESLDIARHLKFGVTDEMIARVTQGHTAAVPGCESNSLANSYLIKSGKVSIWTDKYEADIIWRIQSGDASFTLPIVGGKWQQPSFNNLVYPVVAYSLSEQTWEVDGEEYTVEASYADDADELSFMVTECNL